MRNDRERLLDIREAIENIEKYSSRGRKAFEQDELLQVWMVHNLQIIGEAVARLSDQLKAQHDTVPWRQITGMRNVLVHGYFDVDPEVVWNAVEADIPRLKAALNSMTPK